tara:strand:- start:1298 stop:1810 length:513 start_codon:yes stop_codon:yes gene_type:complete
MSIAVAEDQKLRIAQETEDGNIFLELWGEYIDTQIEMGSDIIKTDKTMNYFEDIFWSYVDGTLDGVTIFGADNNAVLMWGETGSDFPYDTSRGKWGSCWGTYIRPEYRRMGWSKRMREIAKKILQEQGFETLVGGVFSKNKIGRKTCDKSFSGNVRSHHETFLVDLGGNK